MTNELQNLLDSGCALLYIKASQYFGIDDANEADFLQLLCGLKASAGAVVISKNQKAVFVDGRYELAAKLTVSAKEFSIEPMSSKRITEWIELNIPQDVKIAFDPKFFTHKTINKFKENLKDHEFIEIDLDGIFQVQKSKRDQEIISWPADENRFQQIYDLIEKNNLDGYLICDPCSSAWLLNTRDLKTKNTPVVLGYLFVNKYKEKIFYKDESYKDGQQSFLQDISKLNKIGTDYNETPAFVRHRRLIDIKNPIPAIKCIKTDDEIDNIKKITLEDSRAILDFIYWFDHNDNLTEMDCVEKIYALRKRSENFVENSFDTIAAADEHSAIVHYSPTEKTNKSIDNFLLLDSGGQYKYGTTDITRTLSKRTPTDQQKLYYTLVLKGYIAVANARLPKGTAGDIPDQLARKYLLEHSLDFNHGTGHGIGYMLGVHEGPVALSKNNKVPLQANMLLSNEPGVYIENELGIRLENMMIVKDDGEFISFETISLVPFDRKFIDFSLLTDDEKTWLNNYNDNIINSLNFSDIDWLKNYS